MSWRRKLLKKVVKVVSMMEVVNNDHVTLGDCVKKPAKILAILPRQSESLAKSWWAGNDLGKFAGNMGLAGGWWTWDDDVLVLPHQRHVPLNDWPRYERVKCEAVHVVAQSDLDGPNIPDNVTIWQQFWFLFCMQFPEILRNLREYWEYSIWNYANPSSMLRNLHTSCVWS